MNKNESDDNSSSISDRNSNSDINERDEKKIFKKEYGSSLFCVRVVSCPQSVRGHKKAKSQRIFS